MRRLLLFIAMLLGLGGCAAFPEVTHKPQFHNPFPQLMRVAVLPFYNQSEEPTLNGDDVALAYHNELQQIRGFEVMPVGTARQLMIASAINPQTAEDFQKLARFMGVDAVVVGSVTDFSEYYPPRMGLAVNWYAANPCFHPIPSGYGLPWGTPEEEFIPEPLLIEAEFALAREQLATQTPVIPLAAPDQGPLQEAKRAERMAGHNETAGRAGETGQPPLAQQEQGTPLPADWPDPSGFVPRPPAAEPPACKPFYGPILSQVRQYHGTDQDFTEALASYYHFRDDARFGGWQSYLQRKDDFIRFCCFFHIAEMLTARGGADQTRVAWRWPFGRYEQ